MHPVDVGMAKVAGGAQKFCRQIGSRAFLSIRIAAAGALCLTTGCSGFFVYPGDTSSSTGTTSTGDYVYVANASTSNLAGFAVGTGSLTALANSPYALSVSPTALAINPANTLLFVAGGDAIYAYSIQSTGALSILNSGSPVAAATVQSMVVSPDGQWLLALDKSAAAIDEYQIDSSNGGLTPHIVSFSVSGAVSHAIAISPNAEFVFAALGTGGELVFPFNTANGTLSTPTSFTPPAATSDNALAVDPNSTYLYVARSSGSTGGGLVVYTINGGALSQVSGSPYAAGSQPASEVSVVVNKAGTDAYIANYTDGTISGYSIASGGQLTALSGSPYSAGSLVDALAVDNSGDYLLATAQNGSPDLALYSFDATTAGKLDLAASSTTGTDPTEAVAIAATH